MPLPEPACDRTLHWRCECITLTSAFARAPRGPVRSPTNSGRPQAPSKGRGRNPPCALSSAPHRPDAVVVPPRIASTRQENTSNQLLAPAALLEHLPPFLVEEPRGGMRAHRPGTPSRRRRTPGTCTFARSSLERTTALARESGSNRVAGVEDPLDRRSVTPTTRRGTLTRVVDPCGICLTVASRVQNVS